MKKYLLGFSLMELMISTSILAGILYAGSMIVQQQEQAQRKISRGISRNAAFNMIGKKLLDETQCNTFLRGHTFGQNISNILQNTLPKEIQQKMTVSAATILDHALSPVSPNRIAPFILDVTLSFNAVGGGNDSSNYRFFLEAQFDGTKKIVFCVNSQVSMLSASCDLLGGTLGIRDVDGDGIAQEVACVLATCPAPPAIGVLNQLYNANPTTLIYPSPLISPYRFHDALSRECLVLYISTFLNQVASATGRYVLQKGSDTMSGTLEGTGGSATFQTNMNLVAHRWGIGGIYRTILQNSCPLGKYANGVNVDGSLSCANSPLAGLCTPVCPIDSELCRGFIYEGVNGCGGLCYVTGTRPPACQNGDTDPTLCYNQTRTAGNGCGGTCTLRGSILPSCPTSTDPNVCSGTCYTATGICGASCTICGTQTTGSCAPPANTPTPTTPPGTTPTPTTTPPTTSGYCAGYSSGRQAVCATWSAGNTAACCASQTWAGPSPCPPTCGTPPVTIKETNCPIYYEQYFDCTVCGGTYSTIGTPCLWVSGSWGTNTWASNVQSPTLWSYVGDHCPCPSGCTKTAVRFTQTSEIYGSCYGAYPGKHEGVFTSTCSCP